ncbi:hypothetical protein MAR_021413 [Mya arenaria]|uniref:Uncharacterized protein n=1 Tax=Mya arenaria TaxID=6604 RepID=A0ABY7EA46_MYAAR|nr:hypothetical protein MAR_021413 [Mya arenaria]
MCTIHVCKDPLVQNVITIFPIIAFAYDYPFRRLISFKVAFDENERAKMEMLKNDTITSKHCLTSKTIWLRWSIRNRVNLGQLEAELDKAVKQFTSSAFAAKGLLKR